MAPSFNEREKNMGLRRDRRSSTKETLSGGERKKEGLRGKSAVKVKENSRNQHVVKAKKQFGGASQLGRGKGWRKGRAMLMT